MNRRLTQAELRYQAAREEAQNAADSLRWRFQGDASGKPLTQDMIRAAAWFLTWADKGRDFDDALLKALGLEWHQHESGEITLEPIAKAKEPTT